MSAISESGHSKPDGPADGFLLLDFERNRCRRRESRPAAGQRPDQLRLAALHRSGAAQAGRVAQRHAVPGPAGAVAALTPVAAQAPWRRPGHGAGADPSLPHHRDGQ